MGMIIAGKDCENCQHASIDENNKARVKVYCSARDKWYYWGTSVNCEDKIKINK